IADCVAESVVDRLEPVEIGERYAQRAARRVGFGERLGQEAVEVCTVVEIRERVALVRLLEPPRALLERLRAPAQAVDDLQRVEIAQHQRLARLLENLLGAVRGQDLGFEDAFGVRDDLADLVEQVAENVLVHAEIPLRAVREAREAALAGLVEEYLGNHAGESRATREYAVRALLRYRLGSVTCRDDLLRALRELPALEQPAADDGVIDAEPLLLARDQRGLTDLLGAELLVEAGHGPVERHHTDVLNQAGEEQLLAVLDADGAREHVACRRG